MVGGDDAQAIAAGRDAHTPPPPLSWSEATMHTPLAAAEEMRGRDGLQRRRTRHRRRQGRTYAAAAAELVGGDHAHAAGGCSGRDERQGW